MGLHRAFSNVYNGKIWNIIPVMDRNRVVLEVRDDEQFLASFASVSLIDSRILWEGLEFEEKWWISLVAAQSEIALLQTFQGGGNPERKDLLALELDTGELRWTVEKFSFYGWGADGSVLGFESGSELRKAKADAMSGMKTSDGWRAELQSGTTEAFSPAIYLEGNAHFDSVAAFIKRHEQQPISHGVEYLEFHHCIGMSYYVKERGFLANYLLVIDKEGDLVLKEKLGENLPGIGVHTFFALPDCLIFVKNKKELVSYKHV